MDGRRDEGRSGATERVSASRLERVFLLLFFAFIRCPRVHATLFFLGINESSILRERD